VLEQVNQWFRLIVLRVELASKPVPLER